MKRIPHGLGGVFIFVVLLVAMIAVMAVYSLSRINTNVNDQSQSAANLATAAAALEQFAGSTGRLPCPADPTKDDGLASPNAATINCDFQQGTLPWRTVGMRRDDAFDAWGWKISYRVYSNTAGSMTQDQGASMVNCDTVQALTARQPVDPATLLCPAAHDTIDSDFISGKGLSITDFGTVYDGTKATGGAAYVLVSHGPSGLGAYTASGAQKDSPNSTAEKNNMKATGPFTAQAASGPDVSATDNTHFDDVLLYRTVADLARRANLAARDWPDNVLAGVKFDAATIGSALGGGNASPGDLGVASLSFPYATVTAVDSARNLSYVGGGNQGIGETGGSSNSLNSGEGIRIALNQKARRLAITLGSFGTGSFFGFPYSEQVQFKFFNASSSAFLTTTLRGCNSDGGLASFTIDAAGPFDSVTITSEPTTIGFIGSNFVVSEFRSCTAAGTCTTTLDTGAAPSGNHCTGVWP